MIACQKRSVLLCLGSKPKLLTQLINYSEKKVIPTPASASTYLYEGALLERLFEEVASEHPLLSGGCDQVLHGPRQSRHDQVGAAAGEADRW